MVILGEDCFVLGPLKQSIASDLQSFRLSLLSAEIRGLQVCAITLSLILDFQFLFFFFPGPEIELRASCL
jgi:hypothetical protein